MNTTPTPVIVEILAVINADGSTTAVEGIELEGQLFVGPASWRVVVPNRAPADESWVDHDAVIVFKGDEYPSEPDRPVHIERLGESRLNLRGLAAL